MGKYYHTVLSIAGSDSGGGAGIQADIKAISACGAYAATAITAITIQNTVGVFGVVGIPVSAIKQQIEVVLEDIGADAVKIGMLHSAEVIEAVVDCIDKYHMKNIVVDPVMVATSGDRLLATDAVRTLTNKLLPKAMVITPNIPEAEIILGKKIDSQVNLPAFAAELAGACKTSVLLKAGHLQEAELTDVFFNYNTDEILTLNSNRINTANTHGTGCSLSSAFAAFLAQGYSLEDSAKNAKRYISEAIEAGADYKIGKGHGPVKHFYKYW